MPRRRDGERMTTLLQPNIDALLTELLADADAHDDDRITQAIITYGKLDEGFPPADEMATLLAEAALPVSREVGKLLYALVRSTNARTVVEFGTSFGVSTIHLATAVIDAAIRRTDGSRSNFPSMTASNSPFVSAEPGAVAVDGRKRVGYRPFQTGERFSTKDRVPSAASWESLARR